MQSRETSGVIHVKALEPHRDSSRQQRRTFFGMYSSGGNSDATHEHNHLMKRASVLLPHDFNPKMGSIREGRAGRVTNSHKDLKAALAKSDWDLDMDSPDFLNFEDVNNPFMAVRPDSLPAGATPVAASLPLIGGAVSAPTSPSSYHASLVVEAGERNVENRRSMDARGKDLLGPSADFGQVHGLLQRAYGAAEREARATVATRVAARRFMTAPCPWGALERWRSTRDPARSRRVRRAPCG